MNKERVEYWLDIADYDLETAVAMFKTYRWLYVGFMCHQVLEKTLKAYWSATQNTPPPYIHNLIRIEEGCGLNEILSEEQLKFLDTMMPMNIEARYPEYKDGLLRTLSKERCEEMINKTKEFSLWIKNRLSVLSDDTKKN